MQTPAAGNAIAADRDLRRGSGDDRRLCPLIFFDSNANGKETSLQGSNG
jgi:hypothetical protein